MKIVDKILAVFIVLILMTATGLVGFYYGGKSSPISTALSTLGDIAYDNEAEAEFNTQIGILDAQLAEKDIALAESEQRNEGLLRRVANHQEDYSSFSIMVEESRIENKDIFEDISADLEQEIEDNEVASNNLLKLNMLFDNERSLFTEQLDRANTYISVLEDSNTGILKENTLLRSINKQVIEQNQIMRERIEDISGTRARHGPGMAAGSRPHK